MRVIRVPELLTILGISRATLWRLTREAEDFPRPIRVSRAAVGYLESDVRAYLERRVVGRVEHRG